MLRKNLTSRLLLLSSLPLLLGGCFSGALSFPVAGAYFPDWLTCLFIGIISSALLRVLFLALRIDQFLSFRLFTYLSLGSIIGLLSWIFYFGP